MEDIKSSVKDFFVRLNEAYKKTGKKLKVPFNPKVSSVMYEGLEDDEGYIAWKVVEQKETVNEAILSSEIGFDIHISLIEFLNSYYFFELSGTYDNYGVDFDSIVPNTILKNFISRRYISLKTDVEKIDLIQIGVICMENNDNFLMCFVNNTGQIVYYDYDKGNIEVISDSLEELINNLEPRC